MPKKIRSKIASLAGYSDSENDDDDNSEQDRRSVEDGEIEDDDDDGEVHSQDHHGQDHGIDERLRRRRRTDHHSSDSNSQGSGRERTPEESFFEDLYGDQDGLTITDYHRSLYGKRPEEITVPPPSRRRRPPEELQRRIERYYEKVRLGSDLNRSIQARKDLRNPSIYEKMISYCAIDEMASNYPSELYDPEPYLGTCSYYEELSRQQTELMQQQNSGLATATGSADASTSGAPEPKKSKWDSGPASKHQVAKSAAVAAALSKAQTLAAKQQLKKPTVVTAFGTINKRK